MKVARGENVRGSLPQLLAILEVGWSNVELRRGFDGGVGVVVEGGGGG